MEGIYFRKATVEDCYFIRSLFINKEYEEIFAEKNTTVEEWKDRFQYYNNYENFIICNSSSHENIGWIMYEIKDKQCKLHLIALKQEELGKNFGYKSLLEMIKRVEDIVKCIKLDVQKQNERAVNFYKRLGFILEGEEEQLVGECTQWHWNMKYLVS